MLPVCKIFLGTLPFTELIEEVFIEQPHSKLIILYEEVEMVAVFLEFGMVVKFIQII